MGEIQIITASAGSGKTYHLVEELRKALCSEEVRPEAVLATTFTNKAAAELEERARQHLIRANKAELAHRLAAARIGTVNAVCGRFVEQFSFELDLPPDLRVLDDAASATALAQSLSTVLDLGTTTRLGTLKSRMPHFEWRDFIRAVIQQARMNGLEPADLADCGERSLGSMMELLGDPVDNGDTLDQDLIDGIDAFVSGVAGGADSTKKTGDLVSRAKKCRGQLRSGTPMSWHDWVALSSPDKVGKKSVAVAEAMNAAASRHDVHPRLHNDVSQAITLVFKLAADALSAYQAHKQKLGAIDFVDQEVLALQLLRREEYREHIAGQLDLVLVDEFQDTSPLQLAIFLELARLAKRSIWVGDQKQAIFGFRGTDPALMDHALKDLTSGTDPELVDKVVDAVIRVQAAKPLLHSWRSRPELVHLTSDIFVQAFAPHDLPEDRVRLEPAPGHETEPEGLGPVVEFWPLGGKVKADRAEALAAGVRDMLRRSEDGKPASVRDIQSGGVRPMEPGDIAILCGTNLGCSQIAEALEALDIRADVPRVGLLNTPEARVALMALQLWLDPRDRLAQAGLARVFCYADDPNAWLEVALDKENPNRFATLEPAGELLSVRESCKGCGIVEAFDISVQSVDLHSLIRRWGRAPERLANLEAMRSHVVNYVSRSQSNRLPSTVAGALRHLSEITEDRWDHPRTDISAVRGEGDAVTVMTRHRSKGLEWPVTVLHGLDGMRLDDALKVSAVSEREEFDLEDPLGGRWIRFWPTPYWGLQKGTPFYDRVTANPESERIQKQSRKEQLRVLYVAWTRSRDRLILSSQPGKLMKNGLLSLLVDGDGAALMSEPTGSPTGSAAATPAITSTTATAVWGGREFSLGFHPVDPAEIVPADPVAVAEYVRTEVILRPPAFVAPSAMEGTGRTIGSEVIGDRLTLSSDVDMRLLGEAVHGFLAADRVEFPDSDRELLAKGLLDRWSVSALEPRQLLRAGDALRTWVETRFGQARWLREWTVQQRLPEGSVVRGTADLVLETETGIVVVDHKSFPGGIDDALARAAGFAPQLAGYARGLEIGMGAKVAGTFVHLPIVGMVVEVNPGTVPT